MFEDRYGRSLWDRVRFTLFGEFRHLYWIAGLSLALFLTAVYAALHLIIKYW